MNYQLIKFILLPSLVVLISEIAFSIEDEHFIRSVEIKDGSNISVEECVSAAFKYSPKIKKNKFNLDLAKSNVGIAKSQYFPVISAGIGFYNENNSDNIYYNSHNRDFPSIGIAINQLIYNFGKTTSYIKMEEFYKIGAEYEYMDSICAALFDVKDKYYRMLRAKAMVDIANNDLFINEEIVKISKKKPDLNTAKINLAEAKIRIIEAENSYRNARINLSNSMYLDTNPIYTIKNTGTFSFENDFDYSNDEIDLKEFKPIEYSFNKEDAVKLAYENSPDLKVLIATKNAMEQSLKYIKKTYFPDLTGTIGYGYNNTKQTNNSSLTVGVNLTSAVNIKELYHSIKGAQAQVDIANNEINLFKKDIFFELKRAFNNVDRSINQIPIAEKEAEYAFKNLKLMEKEYKANNVDYTSLQDARKDFINAQQQYIDALFNYNIALIQVEMAMHVHIADIHHKSEHAIHYHSSELLEHLDEALECDEEKAHKQKRKRLFKREEKL